jgi:hydrogenase maturation protease
MVAAEHNHRIVIAGLGNLLLRDDGIGVHAVTELRRDPPARCEVVDVGTAILHALSFVENAEKLLLIDAVRAGRAPGTVYLFIGNDVRAETSPTSLHSMGLCASIRMLPPEQRPKEILVLGVEPAVIDYGMELSPVVRDVLPRVVATARMIASEWFGSGSISCFCAALAASTEVTFGKIAS